MVEFYDDRVEVSNPGGLVSAVPESEFGKRSHSRNPLIFGLFARMHLVEQVGSGIGRIRDLMQEAALPEPVFQKRGMFTVVMQRPGKTSAEPSEKPSEKTSEKILRLIGENNQITIEELSERVGKSTRAIEMQIKKLKDRNLLERIGPDKGGYWQLVDKE
ncbi:ATP-binding protein [Persicitalea sp.]|uniref:ATP-binding protein n=1 Tax=Persicitalea sp. TaxID=3100273 RepID=UPI003593AA2A